MVLLTLHNRRGLNCLCAQFLLWILCAVDGEEQQFSVEVRDPQKR